jgi:hypothetical protein
VVAIVAIVNLVLSMLYQFENIRQGSSLNLSKAIGTNYRLGALIRNRDRPVRGQWFFTPSEILIRFLSIYRCQTCPLSRF